MYDCMANGLGRASAESKCTDIDDCSEKQNPCTGPFELCQNEMGSFMCDCTTNEFERPSVDTNCTDIGECSEEQNPCAGPYEICQNKKRQFHV